MGLAVTDIWLSFLFLGACTVNGCVLTPSSEILGYCVSERCNQFYNNSPSLQVNCKCDSDCVLYDDCCIGYTPAAAGNSTTHSSSVLHESMECWTVDFTGDLVDDANQSLLMVSRCPATTERRLNTQCTNRSLFLPVTNTNSQSSFIFRNLYCALCNNISMEQVVPWQPRFYCHRSIVNSTSNFSSFEEFRNSCYLYKYASEAPATARTLTRSCVPHISKCPTDINSTAVNTELLTNCTKEPYNLVSAMDNSRRIFRNRYCAQCNGFNNTQCPRVRIVPDEESPKLTGSVKLANVTWNNLTIQINRTSITCGCGRQWDPSSGKCTPFTIQQATPTPTPSPTTLLPPPPDRCPLASCNDTPAVNSTDGVGRVCNCDDKCILYKDCCYDTKRGTNTTKLHNHIYYNLLECEQTDFIDVFSTINKNYYMVSRCPSEWVANHADRVRADEVSINCSSSALLPLTDSLTNFTFRNIYCAQCNNVNMNNLTPWQPHYRCNVNTTLDAKKLPLRTLEDVSRLCMLQKFIPSPTARTCLPRVSTCPNRTNVSTAMKCRSEGYEPYREFGEKRLFRNKFCADCNGVTNSMRSCFVLSPPPGAGPPPDNINVLSFTTFLDVTGTGSTKVPIVLNTRVYCKLNEVFDEGTRQCRARFSPTIVIVNFTLQPDNISINCTAPIVLNSSEYEEGENNDTLTYEGEVYKIITHDSQGRPIICTNFTSSGIVPMNETREMPPLAFIVLTYITSSFSIIGSIAILLTYSIFKELRSLPSKILMNLASAFLAGDLLILLYNIIASSFASIPLEGTATTAILLHFFMLSRFSWMNLMAFETCRVFSLAVKLQSDISKKSKRILLLIYLLIGWGLPLAITVITIIVNYTTDGLVLYGETSNGSAGRPWINHHASAAVVFLTPAVLALLFNGAAFITVVVLLCKSAQSNQTKGKSIAKYWKHIRISGALFAVLGVSWVLGLFALLPVLKWAWYPFIIFSASQALWIALTFLLTEKIIKLYISLITCDKQLSKASTQSKKTTAAVSFNVSNEKSIIMHN